MQPTLANIAQGYADTRLVTQMRPITFLARPTLVLEFSVRGWQMAWYLTHKSRIDDFVTSRVMSEEALSINQNITINPLIICEKKIP